MTRQTSIVHWSPADRDVYLSVTEFYGGDHPHFWTERLSLAMDDDDESVEVAVDVTERDLWELGQRFLAAYGRMRDQRLAHERSGPAQRIGGKPPVAPEPLVMGVVYRDSFTFRHKSGCPDVEGFPERGGCPACGAVMVQEERMETRWRDGEKVAELVDNQRGRAT